MLEYNVARKKKTRKSLIEDIDCTMDFVKVRNNFLKLFEKLYSNTDCQSSFKVEQICDMIMSCFQLKGSKVSQGDKLLKLAARV